MILPRFSGLLVAAAVTGFAATVQAQLIPCRETSALDKVYLDDVRPRVATDAQNLDTLIQRLGFKLTANLTSLENRSTPGMKGLVCTARYPQGDGDFTPTLCQNLQSEKVLLEVWSSVHREMDDDDEPFNVVDLSVVVVPLAANRVSSDPSGVLVLRQRCKPGESVKQSLKRLDAASMLWGLSRVACGLRAYALKNDKDAYGPLCEGTRVLRTLKDSVQRTACAPLADHADRIAAAARDRLVANGLPDFINDAASCAGTP